MSDKPKITLLNGDCREVMRTLPEKSIHAIITSSPYWMKRKYNDPPVVYGGDAACVHEWTTEKYVHNTDKTAGEKQRTSVGSVGRDEPIQRDTCAMCGAWRGELGWEPTPQLFVQHLVEVFAECWRVLRDDGLLFVNLMDTRVGGKGASGQGTEEKQAKRFANGETLTRGVSNLGIPKGTRPSDDMRVMRSVGLKPKDMALVPQRFVIAMQEYGWYVRSTIIWAKGESFNPYRAGSAMPESARDRPTDTHEYIFMFSKQPRYYSDMAAVAEAANYDGRKDTRLKPSDKYAGRNIHASQPNTMHNDGAERWRTDETGKPVRNLRSVWTLPPAKLDGDVWRVNTRGTSVKHYATWCSELAETMIRMSTSEHGCCAVCGAPWERITEKTGEITSGGNGSRTAEHNGLSPSSGIRSKTWTQNSTVGWRPTCDCKHEPHQWNDELFWGGSRGEFRYCVTCGHDADVRWYVKEPENVHWGIVSATVLDPFGGSGTTGRAAHALGRNSICIELKQEYHEIAEEHNPATEKPELPVEVEQRAESGQMVLF